MPHRGWPYRVQDIFTAHERIMGFLEGMSFEAFAADQRTIDAVVYNFVIIGEAARHIPESIQLQHPDVPWRDMIAMRNFLAHVYWERGAEVIWDTALDDLPRMIQPLNKIDTRDADETDTSS